MSPVARIVPPGIGIVLTLAAVVAAVGLAFLQTADTLAQDIRVTLTPVAASTTGRQLLVDEAVDDGGLDLMIVCGPPTGAARAVQLVLLIVLLGGIPASIVGRVMIARFSGASQQADLSGLFLAGFVFQLSNLVLTAFLLFGLTIAATDSFVEFEELLTWGVALALNILCGVPGLKSWHKLRLSSSEHYAVLGVCPHGAVNSDRIRNLPA